MIRVQSIVLPTPRSSIFEKLMNMAAIARQRRALARLDADRLADIGITAEMAAEEAARPAWDAPRHWRS